LKSRLVRADKELLALRRAVEALAPRRSAGAGGRPESVPDAPPDQPEQLALFDAPPEGKKDALSPALPEPLYAREGTVFFRELPPAAVRPLYSLLPSLQDWLERSPEDPAHEKLLELYFSLHDLLRTADRYDGHSVTQLTARGSELTIRLLCLDPSAFVDESLACGRASVLFSATLIPPGYYKQVLGCGGARAVALESHFPPGNLRLYCLPGISTRYSLRAARSGATRSPPVYYHQLLGCGGPRSLALECPFPPGNLGLYCLPGISTRYRQREASAGPISDALAVLAQSKVGNYLAFFPSYAYLQQ